MLDKVAEEHLLDSVKLNENADQLMPTVTADFMIFSSWLAYTGKQDIAQRLRPPGELIADK